MALERVTTTARISLSEGRRQKSLQNVQLPSLPERVLVPGDVALNDVLQAVKEV